MTVKTSSSLFLALCLLPLEAATIPGTAHYDFTGPRTVIAGSRTMFVMTPVYFFTVTSINASTDVFTADSTYTPVNGNLVRAQSSGTLPAGMYGMIQATWGVYVLTNVSGQTFKLCEAAGQYSPPGTCTGATLNVTDAGTGTLTLFLNDRTGSAPRVYIEEPTGFPASTTFDYLVPGQAGQCGVAPPTSGGKMYVPFGYVICQSATVPSDATPGTQTVTFNFCADTMVPCGNPGTYVWDIEVVAPPTVTYTPPSSFTTPTAKAAWETLMTTRPCPGSSCGNYPNMATLSGPANYCEPLASPSPVNSLGAAINESVSMYGWGLVFDNMAIYTGNSVYRTGCFQDTVGHLGNGSSTLSGAINNLVITFNVAAASDFTNNMVLQMEAERIFCTTFSGLTFSGCTRGYTGGGAAASHSNGVTVSGAPYLSARYTAVSGGGVNLNTFINHSEALFRAGRVFGDSTYTDAGILFQNQAYTTGGPKPRFDNLRENSWGMFNVLNIKKYANVDVANITNFRDGLLSVMLRATESDASGVRFPLQTFILYGIAASAFIKDWQASGDTRILYLIKRLNDYFWDTLYDSTTTHAFINQETPGYTPSTNSPYCGSTTVFFTTFAQGNCGNRPLNYQSLQMMIAHTFWWYYAMTGDTTYRDRGDDIAGHAFDNSFGGMTGKQGSEIYFNSFNAFGWRMGTLSPYDWYGDTTIPGGSNLRVPSSTRVSGAAHR